MILLKNKAVQDFGRDRQSEGEIGVSYDIIDKILDQINFNKILKNSTIPEIRGVNEKDVRTVIEWINSNRHKHELPIPICKLNFE